MAKKPDFFMTAVGEMSAEADLSRARACWGKARLTDGFRDDYMLIDIDPPVIGQHYGLGGEDIAELIVATRLEGEKLFPVSEWPLHVYVLRVLDEAITQSLAFTKDQVAMIGWAELYPTREETEAEVEKGRVRNRYSRGGEG